MIDETTYVELMARIRANNAAWCERLPQIGALSVEQADALLPYAAIATNEAKGACEVFELHRDRPARFLAYVSGLRVTTWPGDVVGTIVRQGAPWKVRSWMSETKQNIIVRADWGDVYTGTSNGDGLYVRLRKVSEKVAQRYRPMKHVGAPC